MRDDFHEGSDLDLLVEFEPGQVPGLSFFAMQDELTALLGRTVDLNTAGWLSPCFRDEVRHAAKVIMTPDKDRTRLEHMRGATREAMELIRSKTREDLDRDRLLNLALVRLMEIVGEAAARVTAALRDAHSEIPWPLIVGLRNRLIHGY